MQSQAYRITGFAAVMAAVGFMLRWLQGLIIYDEETGLANRGAGINIWVICVIVLTLGALLVWCFKLKKYPACMNEDALVGRTVLHTVAGCTAGAVLLLAGVILLFTAGTYAAPGLRRVLALMELLAGASAIVVTVRASKAQFLRARQICYVILVLFGCFLMVTEYKENAANPVIWAFAPEILAACMATLALYYMAGYQFAEPKPYAGIFTCYAGMFLCVLCIVDMGLSADAAAFFAVALLLGMFGFLQVENLLNPNLTGAKQ